jgi:hypothetical protein
MQMFPIHSSKTTGARNILSRNKLEVGSAMSEMNREHGSLCTKAGVFIGIASRPYVLPSAVTNTWVESKFGYFTSLS